MSLKYFFKKLKVTEDFVNLGCLSISLTALILNIRPQLVESSVIVIRAHLVKVYNNYASTLIIYKINKHFSFLPITYFP